MKNKALTLTVIANMTSNYGESLGNISSVQKVFRGGKEYATRSRESLKNAICVQSGFYDDLQTSNEGAMQKLANEDINAATCRALEGGYMFTKSKDLHIFVTAHFTLQMQLQPSRLLMMPVFTITFTLQPIMLKRTV